MKPADTATAPKRTIDNHVLRPEIQALRALAVGLVVIYHLWPTTLDGGYIGVDVFFVISGYLITSHIARGVLGNQTFSLTSFYAKRLRRLLPASLLVLLVTSIATVLWLPETAWNSVGRQLIGSVLYVQNWVLAADAVDYLAAGSEGSPVQHFWSLSVEEQFYLVWPIGFVLAGAFYSRRWSRRASLITLVVAVTVASFAYSVYATQSIPSTAYFVTTTRAWEFGIGALCAFLGTQMLPLWVRAVMGWLGLGALFFATATFDSSTPFPGYAALLPTLGTAAVILAGNVNRPWSTSIFANLRPVQFVGGISYSVYLWHWPLIVFVPYIFNGGGEPFSGVQKAVVFVVSLILGGLTKKFVEDPFRFAGRQRRTNRPPARRLSQLRGQLPVFAFAIVGMLVVGSVAAVPFAISQTRINDARAYTAVGINAPCFGAEAFSPQHSTECMGFEYSEPVTPDPLAAPTDVARQGCQQNAEKTDVITCTFGVTDTSAPLVAVVGDSHANQWMGAIDDIAQVEGWRVVTYFKSGCPFTAAALNDKRCGAWNEAVAADLAANDYEILFTSAVAATTTLAGDTEGRYDRTVNGYRAAWEPLVARGVSVIALADTPRPQRANLEDPPKCVNNGNTACTMNRSEIVASADPIVDAATAFDGVYTIALTDYFCNGEICPSVVGNVLVYRDSNHITNVFARSLAPALSRSLFISGLIR